MSKDHPTKRVLVCGGRHYDDILHFTTIMDRVRATEIVTGGATGTDALAALWAGANCLVLHVVKADWKRHGKAAGLLRNQEMLDRFHPDLVVAFPGGAGTADIVRRAKAAGVEVLNA